MCVCVCVCVLAPGRCLSLYCLFRGRLTDWLPVWTLSLPGPDSLIETADYTVGLQSPRQGFR